MRQSNMLFDKKRKKNLIFFFLHASKKKIDFSLFFKLMFNSASSCHMETMSSKNAAALLIQKIKPELIIMTFS